MHEYLFRGKRKDNGEWVEGSLVTKVDPLLETNYCFILAQGRGESFVTWHMVDPSTVGQFTGLLDKNGKRIFEEDGVRDMDTYLFHARNYGEEEAEKYRLSGDVGVVVFETDGIGSCGCCYAAFVGSGFKAGEVNLTKCEVIGNIHDNPELVEGKV